MYEQPLDQAPGAEGCLHDAQDPRTECQDSGHRRGRLCRQPERRGRHSSKSTRRGIASGCRGIVSRPASAGQVSVYDLDGDSQKEVIYLTESGLHVAPYGHKGRVCTFPVRPPRIPQGFSCRQETGWIALNTLIPGAAAASFLLAYHAGEGLRPVQGDINLWLHFFSAPPAQAGALWGQGFDPEHLYGKGLFVLEPSDRGILYSGHPDITAPILVCRSMWEDLNGNGTPELVALDRDGRLRIYEAGSLLWISPALADPGTKWWMPCLTPVSVSPHGPPVVVCSMQRERGKGSRESLGVLYWDGEGYALSQPSPPLRGRICGISPGKGGKLLVATSSMEDQRTELFELTWKGWN